MGIRNRLRALERKRVPGPGTPVDEPEPTEAEDIRSTGQSYWHLFTGRKRATNSHPPLERHDADRRWQAAAEAAWADGVRKYDELRLGAAARALWLKVKDEVWEHRRTHGRFIYTDPPTELATMSLDEFGRLPLARQVQLLRTHRRGYWSKHGPGSGPRL